MVKHILEQNKSMNPTCAVNLALAFGIITDKTSMVAVSETKVGAIPKPHKPQAVFDGVIYRPSSDHVMSRTQIGMQTVFSNAMMMSAKCSIPVVTSSKLSSKKSRSIFNFNFWRTEPLALCVASGLCLDECDTAMSSSPKNKTYMVPLKMPFEELLAYFRPELGVFSANVLTFIGVDHEIYDPVAITLYMLYLIRSNYTEEQYQKVAKMAVLIDRQKQLVLITNKSVTEDMMGRIVSC